METYLPTGFFGNRRRHVVHIPGKWELEERLEYLNPKSLQWEPIPSVSDYVEVETKNKTDKTADVYL
jgi:hypothetical protein